MQKLQEAQQVLAKEEQDSAETEPPAGLSADKLRRKGVVDTESDTELVAPASGSVADEAAGSVAAATCQHISKPHTHCQHHAFGDQDMN